MAGKIEVTVLRLGHRPERDKRITTHCGLVARAFGAKKIIISGDQDDSLVSRLSGLSKKWGGKFSAQYEKDWKKVIRNFSGKKIHLTMYGEDFRKTAKKIQDESTPGKAQKVLLVVGAGKVPPELYALCDVNTAVGNQPHSEVAALGLLLYELNGAPETFSDTKIHIVPSAGKKTVYDSTRKPKAKKRVKKTAKTARKK